MNELNNNKKTFFGYYLPTNSLSISLIGIFGALVCVVTMVIAFPVPATNGYINIGDAMVMLTAIIFGPVIGGIAGGVGSALADLFLGYILYAPATLIIKALEGIVVGLIANPKNIAKRFSYRDIIGVLIGGLIMVIGYFIYEIILYGLYAAIYEVILNGLIQYGLGILISLLLTVPLRKALDESISQIYESIYIVDKQKFAE
ncbi:MAG: ECF transporter S component [Promethearchaeati archaeon]